MATYEYTGQVVSDTRALRTALSAAGETTPIYTVMGGYVKVEASSASEVQVNAAVALAND